MEEIWDEKGEMPSANDEERVKMKLSVFIVPLIWKDTVLTTTSVR